MARVNWNYNIVTLRDVNIPLNSRHKGKRTLKPTLRILHIQSQETDNGHYEHFLTDEVLNKLETGSKIIEQ